ncbi:hypothetical protein M409DRAFT_70184 [Zasmidium cellare ATCC 36951]|uniref:Methyltransferase n=1 Tax=Zasmidium cellare ATCC 36951 TaxID=1080233 RepID=A0A6A6C1X9_ZASCE|nr:uncharacterized protein M409DRAFT_70184 [Zasmidium cellare ATCC 36951]KAF2160893.1 hypothetical protein M409DRAFT_70184 [Zasmidium cellare ATCC 36951]
MPHKEVAKQPSSTPGIISYLSSEGYPDSKKVLLLGSASDKLRKHDEHAALITDIKTCDEEFTLDKNGFQHIVEPISLRQHYNPEVADMLKRVTGASDVLCMAHLIRSSTWEEAQEETREVLQREGGHGLVQKMNPARTAHCDQSYTGAEQILRINFDEERVKEIMKKRWAIINVWRPLNPIRRDPLAVCDWRSLSEAEDLVGLDIILPTPGKHRNLGKAHGESHAPHVWNRWDIKYNPNHKWYYASNMTPDEVMLLKIFDSKKDGRARCCPHTSFASEMDEWPARESVELRTLVFWDEDAE